MPLVFKYISPGNFWNGAASSLKNWLLAISYILLYPFLLPAQSLSPGQSTHELVFVSDTQQPMWEEKLILKPDHNLLATADIFSEIIKEKPANLYMLGDVVCLGYRDKKWEKADLFLDSCRREGIIVNGVLGNHEVLGREKKGEKNFAKRFPESINTGYVSVTDSVAVVLLNSNFKALTKEELAKQQSWYDSTMASLDQAESIAVIIVACHHAPYSNSKIVGSSAQVQEHFVPAFLQSKKARLFVTGHAHAFEHFKKQGKDFVVIGGGGGLHQPLDTSVNKIADLAADYKPHYHYLSVYRSGNQLQITSHYLHENFTGFASGHSFITNSNGAVASTENGNQSPVQKIPQAP